MNLFTIPHNGLPCIKEITLCFEKQLTYYLYLNKILSEIKMNELMKKKISYKLRGRKKSATTKKLISQALTGRKLSEEHKKKISESMKKRGKFYLTSNPSSYHFSR